jgi:hypothetical protein
VVAPSRFVIIFTKILSMTTNHLDELQTFLLKFLELKDFLINPSGSTTSEIAEQARNVFLKSDFDQNSIVNFINNLPDETKQQLKEEDLTKKAIIQLAEDIYNKIIELHPAKTNVTNPVQLLYQNHRFESLSKVVGFLAEFLKVDDNRIRSCTSTQNSLFGGQCREKIKDLTKGYQDIGLVLFHALTGLYCKTLNEDSNLNEDHIKALTDLVTISNEVFPTFLVLNQGSPREIKHPRDYRESPSNLQQYLIKAYGGSVELLQQG